MWVLGLRCWNESTTIPVMSPFLGCDNHTQGLSSSSPTGRRDDSVMLWWVLRWLAAVVFLTCLPLRWWCVCALYLPVADKKYGRGYGLSMSLCERVKLEGQMSACGWGMSCKSDESEERWSRMWVRVTMWECVCCCEGRRWCEWMCEFYEFDEGVSGGVKMVKDGQWEIKTWEDLPAFQLLPCVWKYLAGEWWS